jgi:DNA recombination protein RmuC
MESASFPQITWSPLYTQALIVFLTGIFIGILMMWLIGRAKFRQSKNAWESERQLKEIEIQHLKEIQEEKLRNLEQVHHQLGDSFKAISADTLRSSQESFLTLAKETLAREREVDRGDLDRRRQEIGELVRPVHESLSKVEGKITDLEKAREGAYRELRHQVSTMADTQVNLQKETGNLVRALRQPIGRGQWGEMQLRRVVELAGMQEHCDFSLQASATTDEGARIRPDLTVNLPGNKMIVVDAKTPMDAYLDAIEAREKGDDEAEQKALEKHSRQVKTHIKNLGKKNYQDQFETSPEFTVLFLPSESFFSDALSQDPGLIENGVQQGVILATPTTLIALLRAVSYGWRQESLNDNAREICALGHEMYDRLSRMSSHFLRLGKNLSASVDSYNQAIGTLETRVLVSARKFRELGAAPEGKELESPSRIDSQTRELQATPLPGDNPPDN